MNIRCPDCRTVFRVDPARIPAAGVRARCSRCSSTFHVSRENADDAVRPAGPARGGESPPPISSPADVVRAAASAAVDAARAVASGIAAATGLEPGPRDGAGESQQRDPAESRESDVRGGAGYDAESGAAQPRHGEAAPEARGEQPAAPQQGMPTHAAAASPGSMQSQQPTAPPQAAPQQFQPAAQQQSQPAQSQPAPQQQSQPAPQQQSQPAPVPGRGEAPARPPLFGSRDPDARAQRIARALISDIVAYHPQRREEALAAGTLRVDFREEIMKSWEEYVAQVGLETARSTPHFRNALNQILAQGQQVF
jgi:predicted Zn finger-like uncharacterized protein